MKILLTANIYIYIYIIFTEKEKEGNGSYIRERERDLGEWKKKEVYQPYNYISPIKKIVPQNVSLGTEVASASYLKLFTLKRNIYLIFKTIHVIMQYFVGTETA